MAYKSEQRNSTVSSCLGDGFSELQTLRDEAREIVDNAGDALANTQRIQTFTETADTLDNYADSEPSDVPAFLAELTVTYTEQVNKRKGKGASRAVRLSNACAMLGAVVEAADNWIAEHNTGDADMSDELRDQIEEAEAFHDEVQDVIDNVEGVEFPGMYG